MRRADNKVCWRVVGLDLVNVVDHGAWWKCVPQDSLNDQNVGLFLFAVLGDSDISMRGYRSGPALAHGLFERPSSLDALVVHVAQARDRVIGN